MKENILTMLKGMVFKWFYVLWTPFLLIGSYLLRGLAPSPYWSLVVCVMLLVLAIAFTAPLSEDPRSTREEKVKTQKVFIFLFLQSLLIMSVILLIDPVNKPMRTPDKTASVKIAADTVVSRVSCDSTMQVITHRKITDSTIVALMWDFTRDTSVYTGLVVASADTLLTYDPLTIDSLRCGDTVVVSKQSIPYYDRNASLARINRKYIEAGKWAVKEETFYRNRSPRIDDLDLIHLFTKKQAQWYHTVRDNKYTLSLLHENKVDTLDSREDAQGLLEAKCKDAATKKKEFSYAEYNACKGNGDITKIKVSRIETCGYASVRISYGRGAISSRPYGCWGSTAGWGYEQ